jgi:hypothetical protein
MAVLSCHPLMHIGEHSTNLQLQASTSSSTLDTEIQRDEVHDLHSLEIRRTPSQTIISFRPSDPEHPNNWSTVSGPHLTILLQPYQFCRNGSPLSFWVASCLSSIARSRPPYPAAESVKWRSISTSQANCSLFFLSRSSLLVMSWARLFVVR